MNSTQALYTQMRSTLSQNPSLIYWPLQMMLQELQIAWQERLEIAQKIIEVLRSEPTESEAAHRMCGLLGHTASVITEKLQGRSEQVWLQIRDHLSSGRVLDFGCGDGRIASQANQTGHSVQAYDIADYRTSDLDLPFTSDWRRLEDKTFETAVVSVVLHHCDEPEQEIAKLHKVAKRVVIIESVIDEAMPWATQAFVDWLYNRGMHPGAEIPVPGQFKTVETWKEIFSRHGFRVIHEQDLGIDLPVVPEHHHLFVLV